MTARTRRPDSTGSTAALASIGPTLTHDEMRIQLRHWLVDVMEDLPPSAPDGASFGERLLAVCELQQYLYDSGWARLGWPEHLGGLGGDARHRAVLYDELASAGFTSRYTLEHLEILAPAVAAHWDAARVREVLPGLMQGKELWCQGFSEPDAGSDLISLRTTATRDGDSYVIQGRKIWTSWASYAQRCVVLVRTGVVAERHRGLSVFFVDLDTEGVEVRALAQANGVDELAEVTFDEVRIPAERLVGKEGEGWQIALDVLACERSTFAWLRQARLQARADDLALIADAESAGELGDLLLDLFALRMSSASAVERLAQGQFLGPQAAPSKLLLTAAEQHLYELARRVVGVDLVMGTTATMSHWQEEYLFSRATSIYGGTREMQLTTVARFLLGLPKAIR
jgi:alkylation response protein AidB-like acyl-CoA dehydrogenase